MKYVTKDRKYAILYPDFTHSSVFDGDEKESTHTC